MIWILVICLLLKAGASEASEDGIKEKKPKTASSAEEMITAYKKELKARQNASMVCRHQTSDTIFSKAG